MRKVLILLQKMPNTPASRLFLSCVAVLGYFGTSMVQDSLVSSAVVLVFTGSFTVIFCLNQGTLAAGKPCIVAQLFKVLLKKMIFKILKGK
jgi:hypothetical protein